MSLIVRNRKNLAGVGFYLLAICGTALLCDIDSSSSGQDEFDPQRRALLSTLAAEVIQPNLNTFAEQSQALTTSLESYSQAVQEASSDQGSQLAAAQDAWRVAMATWQKLELMQLGPAGPSFSRTGGADLRDEIYSWPTVNTCRIDQELVAGNYASSSFTEDNLVNVYGLDAIEYLLFNANSQNTCPSQVSINSEGTWDALTTAQLTKRRADYAAAVAGRVEEQAASLVDRWQNGFSSSLSTAGLSGSDFESATIALDEALAAIFYLDQLTKDKKLAIPAGISDCSASICPDDLESPWADYSREMVSANLEGFREMYLGTITPESFDPDALTEDDHYSFYEFLVDLGEADLAEQMRTDIESALTQVEGEDSLAELLNNNPSGVRAIHEAVKTITDNLKGDFVLTLKLSVPQDAAGDSD